MGRGKRGRGWPHRADRKRKRPPSPPSEDFGDSEYSEEVSSKYDRLPAPASPVASSEDSDDCGGLSVVVRAYWRSIERARLGGSDDSEEASSKMVEDSSDSTMRATVARATVAAATTTTRAAVTTTVRAAATAGKGGDSKGNGDNNGDGSGDDGDGGDGNAGSIILPA
jgi:hypothetical protein